MKGRLQALFDADITLAAYHLALDAHPEIGNNALLARELGVEVEEQFDGIGVGGRSPTRARRTAFAARRPRQLGARAARVPAGPDEIRRVAIISAAALRDCPAGGRTRATTCSSPASRPSRR